MGSWSGHTLPGSFFIFFGIIWSIKTSYRNFFPKSAARSQKPCCLRLKWDMVEAGFKIFASTFGLLIEQLLPYEPKFQLVNSETQEFQHGNNFSHSTMYAFFLVSGIADILVMKMPKIMPHCIHHIAMALAFGVEGYLFYFHTHGREELDVRFHVLLLFAVWPTSLVLLLIAVIDKNENMAEGYAVHPNTKISTHKTESDSVSLLRDNDHDLGATSNGHLENGRLRIKPMEGDEWTELNNLNNNQLHAGTSEESNSERKKIFTLQLIATTLTILQGTWFWQIAYVLYPPSGKKWDQESHPNIMFVTMFFSWHLLLAISVVSGIYCFFGFLGNKRRKEAAARNYSALQTSELP